MNLEEKKIVPYDLQKYTTFADISAGIPQWTKVQVPEANKFQKKMREGKGYQKLRG